MMESAKINTFLHPLHKEPAPPGAPLLPVGHGPVLTCGREASPGFGTRAFPKAIRQQLADGPPEPLDHPRYSRPPSTGGDCPRRCLVVSPSVFLSVGDRAPRRTGKAPDGKPRPPAWVKEPLGCRPFAPLTGNWSGEGRRVSGVHPHPHPWPDAFSAASTKQDECPRLLISISRRLIGESRSGVDPYFRTLANRAVGPHLHRNPPTLTGAPPQDVPTSTPGTTGTWPPRTMGPRRPHRTPLPFGRSIP